MPETNQIIIILVFLGFLSLPLIQCYRIIKRSNQRPVREFEPKIGDSYFSEVFTRTAVGGGRILTIQFHPTIEAAHAAAKKNAQWFDDYGNVHREVGIYWNVGVITRDILEKMKGA